MCCELCIRDGVSCVVCVCRVSMSVVCGLGLEQCVLRLGSFVSCSVCVVVCVAVCIMCIVVVLVIGCCVLAPCIVQCGLCIRCGRSCIDIVYRCLSCGVC